MVLQASRQDGTTIPPRAGVGLKAKHYRTIIGEQPNIGFFEVHAENYMGEGFVTLAILTIVS